MAKKLSFERQIKQLENAKQERVVFFAWLCAVRALPFLGEGGHFDFWRDGEARQTYLYGVLLALDAAKRGLFSRVRTVARAATDAADAAVAAVAHMGRAAGVADAAAAAAYAACSPSFAAKDAAANAAHDALSAGVPEDLLWEDLRHILNDECALLHRDTAVYGSVWDNFQTALRDADCAYWGRLYTQIFADGFVVDKEALERRLNVPKEIRALGAAEVGHWLEKQEREGAERLNEARIIILGEKGAGKTCLARRLIDPDAEMTREKDSTEGVNTTLWTLDGEGGEPVNAHLWDFAGHYTTHAVHRCFLSERCLYVIVYDGRTESRNRLAYWLEHIKTYGGDSPVKVLVNLRDGNRPAIEENTLKREYPSLLGFDYFSIGDDRDALERFRRDTAAYIRANPLWNRQTMPAGHYRVKQVLEARFARDEHITKWEYRQIAAVCGVEARDADNLLGHLHVLGICLWYRELSEFNTLVLNPDWITHGIYRLINWGHNNKRYTLSLEDGREVFTDEAARYPEEKLRFVFELMKVYELAYSKERRDVITVPLLLGEDSPADLSDFSGDDMLKMRYESKTPLPLNTVSRLIVRRHQDVRDERRVWRYGAILEAGDGAAALVQEKNDGREIDIWVKGPHASGYIAQLRDEMEEIFAGYKREKPELNYRVIPPEPLRDERGDVRELMLTERTIRNHAKHGWAEFLDDVSGRGIPLEPTIQIFQIQSVQTQKLFIGGVDSSTTHDSHDTYTYHDCNIAMQGELNCLAGDLETAGHADIAAELKAIVAVLERTKNVETGEGLQGSGLLTRLKRFFEKLGDEGSTTRKVVAGLEYGLSTARSIAETYNKIAKQFRLPPLPEFLL